MVSGEQYWDILLPRVNDAVKSGARAYRGDEASDRFDTTPTSCRRAWCYLSEDWTLLDNRSVRGRSRLKTFSVTFSDATYDEVSASEWFPF
jgi:hypothetical protein